MVQGSFKQFQQFAILLELHDIYRKSAKLQVSETVKLASKGHSDQRLRGTHDCWYHILHTITLPVPVHDQPLSHSPFGGGYLVGVHRPQCGGPAGLLYRAGPQTRDKS